MILKILIKEECLEVFEKWQEQQEGHHAVDILSEITVLRKNKWPKCFSNYSGRLFMAEVKIDEIAAITNPDILMDRAYIDRLIDSTGFFPATRFNLFKIINEETSRNTPLNTGWLEFVENNLSVRGHENFSLKEMFNKDSSPTEFKEQVVLFMEIVFSQILTKLYQKS